MLLIHINGGGFRKLELVRYLVYSEIEAASDRAFRDGISGPLMQGLKARVLHQLGGVVLSKAHLADKIMLEFCRFSTYSYGRSRCSTINHIEYYSEYHVPLQDYI